LKSLINKLLSTVSHRLLSWDSSDESDPIIVENVFNYRPDDVVIVSYPKSGSTWLRFIFANLINNLIPDVVKEVDFLRAQLTVPEIPQKNQNDRIDFEVLPSPRIMRSHSLYNSIFPKVIYLLRDVRDVLISYYYHYKKFNGFEGSLYDFLCSDVRSVEWDEHVNSWIYQNTSLNNIYIVKYEDMLDNPFREVVKMQVFLGLNWTEQQVLQAIEKSDFHALRQIEQEKGLGYVDAGDQNIHFIRRGRSGDWKRILGDKEKIIIKKKYGEVLIKAGYEGSYQW